jgi:O-antigen/teichoic acid export membrane protein
MGIVKRQSMKASIVNYVGMGLGMLNMLILFPMLLSPEQSGVINSIQFWGMLLIMVPAFATGPLLVTYYFKQKTEEDKKDLLSSSFCLLLIGLVLFSILFHFIQPILIKQLLNTNASYHFRPYFYLVLPMVWAVSIYAYLETYCIVKLRISVPGFIKEIGIRVFILIGIILFYKNIISYNQLVLSIIIVYILSAISLFIYALSKGFSINLNILHSIKTLTKEHINYMFYIYISQVSISIIIFFGSVWLGIKTGEARVNIFAIGLYVATMIQVPFRAFAQIIIPLISEAWSNNDIEKIKTLNRQSSINFILIGTFLFALLCINVDTILLLIHKPEYLPYLPKLKIIILIIGVGKLIDMFTGLNTEIIATSKYYRFILVSVIVMAMITFATNIYFIPLYGIIGAALSFLIVETIYNAIKFIFLYKKFHFNPFSLNGFFIASSGFVLGIAIYFLQLPFHFIVVSIIKSLLFTIPFLWLVLKYELAPDFNEFIQKLKTGKLF